MRHATQFGERDGAVEPSGCKTNQVMEEIALRPGVNRRRAWHSI
jgi:hypothetical protein